MMTGKKILSAGKARQLAQGNAIDKVCSVLSLLSEGGALRLSEITRATGLNRVTALRILDNLCTNDFLQRSGDPARYSFGPEVVAMAASSSQLGDLRDLVRPSLIRLATTSGDVALLSIRSGLESICIDSVAGDYPINVSYLQVGMRRPLGVSAGSLALLAWLPPDERDAIVDIVSKNSLKDFPRITPGILNQLINDANEKGYAMMLNVVIEKLGAIASPLYDARGNIVAALSIVGLTDRILEREGELASALKDEQTLITRRLSSASAGRSRQT